MKKTKAIIALLLVFALVFAFAACGSKDGGSSDQTPSDQSQDVNNDTGQDQADQADQNTQEDPAEPEPAEEEEPEEEPEEEEPEPDIIPVEPYELSGDYMGEFLSDTGTGLNLKVKWAANPDSEGTYKVTSHIFLHCYSIGVSSRNTNRFMVETSNGKWAYVFPTEAVRKAENTIQDIYIGVVSIILTEEEFNSGAKITVTYDYRGTYSTTELPEIVAVGEIKAN